MNEGAPGRLHWPFRCLSAHGKDHVPPDGAQTLGFSSRRELPPVLPPSEGVLHVMLLHAMDQQARRCHSASKL